MGRSCAKSPKRTALIPPHISGFLLAPPGRILAAATCCATTILIPSVMSRTRRGNSRCRGRSGSPSSGLWSDSPIVLKRLARDLSPQPTLLAASPVCAETNTISYESNISRPFLTMRLIACVFPVPAVPRITIRKGGGAWPPDCDALTIVARSMIRSYTSHWVGPSIASPTPTRVGLSAQSLREPVASSGPIHFKFGGAEENPRNASRGLTWRPDAAISSHSAYATFESAE